MQITKLNNQLNNFFQDIYTHGKYNPFYQLLLENKNKEIANRVGRWRQEK